MKRAVCCFLQPSVCHFTALLIQIFSGDYNGCGGGDSPFYVKHFE